MPASRSPVAVPVPASLLSSRLAAGIAASTRVSASVLPRPPLLDAEGMAGLVDALLPARGDAGAREAFLEGPDPVAADPRLCRELQRCMARHRRELLPGYERRLRLEGKSAADAWLRVEALDRGRREAESLRRRYSEH